MMECSWKTLLLLLCASLAVQFTAIRTLRDSLSGPCQGGYRCQSRHHRGTAAHCTASHQTTKHRDKLHMRCQTKLWHYTVTPAAGGGGWSAKGLPLNYRIPPMNQRQMNCVTLFTIIHEMISSNFLSLHSCISANVWLLCTKATSQMQSASHQQ